MNDAVNKTGIPFASIGVQNTTRGVIAEENGHYDLKILPLNDSDSLIISAIGYYAKRLAYQDLKAANGIIELRPQAVELAEVNVGAKKIYYKTLGITKYTTNNCSGFVKNQINWKGSESAILIPNAGTVRIEDFKFYIIHNTYEDSLTFQLMFYKKNELGKPGETFLKKPIVFRVKQSKGEFVLPLKDYSIVANGDFFVSLECLMEEMDITRFCYSGSYKVPSFVRDSPFSNWARVRGGGSDYNMRVSFVKN